MTVNYIEVRVTTSLDSGEIVALLEDPAPAGAWESDGVVHLFWLQEEWGAGVLDQLHAVLERLGAPAVPGSVTVDAVPDQDWNRTWARSLKPVRIGRHIVIRQSWNSAELPDGAIALVIDPKRAFGSGYHATTQLLAEWLEEEVRGGERVLDAGTGSGILTMIALRLGASSALGIDNDPVAIECAREYAAANGFGPELELRVSAVQDLGPGGFDIVLANIDARTLVATIPSLARAVAPGGALLLSGLQPQDREDITAVLRRAGARIVETRYREEWMALLAKSGDQDRSVLH